MLKTIYYWIWYRKSYLMRNIENGRIYATIYKIYVMEKYRWLKEGVKL